MAKISLEAERLLKEFSLNHHDSLKNISEFIAELEKDQRMLLALEGAGVDNWSGYDYALEALEDEDAGV